MVGEDHKRLQVELYKHHDTAFETWRTAFEALVSKPLGVKLCMDSCNCYPKEYIATMKRGDSYLTDYKDLVNSDFSEKADNYIDLYPTTRGDNSRFTMAGLPEVVKLPSLVPNINTWLEVIPISDTSATVSPLKPMAAHFTAPQSNDTHEQHMRLLASLEGSATTAPIMDNEVLVNIASSNSMSGSSSAAPSSSSSSLGSPGDEPYAKRAKTDA